MVGSGAEPDGMGYRLEISQAYRLNMIDTVSSNMV
jgi:hypothetical protein